MDLQIDYATREEIVAFYGDNAPDINIVWTAKRDGQLVAIGGAAWYPAVGQWFVGVSKVGDMPRFPLHRFAKAFLKILRQEGIERVYTGCDGAVPIAWKWLVSLGFRPVTDNHIALQNGDQVWINDWT